MPLKPAIPVRAGFFNFIIAMIAVSFVFNIIRSVASSGRGGRNDEWDD